MISYIILGLRCWILSFKYKQKSIIYFTITQHNCFHGLLLSIQILNIFHCIYIQISDTCTMVSIVLPIVSVWGPRRHYKFWYIGSFFGRPDDDSIESKHVAIRIFCVINCCVWLKFIPCMN